MGIGGGIASLSTSGKTYELVIPKAWKPMLQSSKAIIEKRGGLTAAFLREKGTNKILAQIPLKECGTNFFQSLQMLATSIQFQIILLKLHEIQRDLQNCKRKLDRIDDQITLDRIAKVESGIEIFTKGCISQDAEKRDDYFMKAIVFLVEGRNQLNREKDNILLPEIERLRKILPRPSIMWLGPLGFEFLLKKHKEERDKLKRELSKLQAVRIAMNNSLRIEWLIHFILAENEQAQNVLNMARKYLELYPDVLSDAINRIPHTPHIKFKDFVKIDEKKFLADIEKLKLSLSKPIPLSLGKKTSLEITFEDRRR